MNSPGSPTKQWFRGTLEGFYVGVPPTGVQHGKQHAHPIRVYRAVVKQVELLEVLSDAPPPAEDMEHVPARPVVQQAECPDVVIEAWPNPGESLHGVAYDLRIAGARFTHPARHEGRIYGRILGQVVGWFAPPPEPAPRDVLAMQLRTLELQAPNAKHTSRAAAAPAELSALADASSPPLPEAAHDELVGAGSGAEPLARAPNATPAPLPASAPRTPREQVNPSASMVPLTATAAAIAIALLTVRSSHHAALWLTFMVPTLILRRFLRGVLEDATPFRAIAAGLLLGEAFLVARLLVEWSSADCQVLHPLPLIGVVACTFLTGLLPYVLPFALDALGLALVLWAWCG